MFALFDDRSGVRVRRLAVVVGLSVFLAGGVQAQSDEEVSISAQAQPTEVGAQEPVSFTIQIRGAAPSDVETPAPPPTTNLVLQDSTPTTQRELSFDSGSLTRRTTFVWTYKPLRIGIGRIQPATVRIRGERYTTDEIRIRIVPQSQRPRRRPRSQPDPTSPSIRDGQKSPSVGARDLFIRLTASDDTAYQNEQVTLEYRLFFRPGVRLRQSRMADAWDAPGFWREELDVASRPMPRTTEVHGRRYKTIVLKRVALFPTRTGRLTVDPLRIETEARARNRLGQRGDALQQSRYEPVALSSEQLTVTAHPLPSAAPSSFEGAVGEFALDTEMSADSVAVGDAVEYTVRLQGSGNIATVSPPSLEVPREIESYEPTVEVQIDRSGEAVHGTKTFTYTLVPRSNGRYTLPPVRLAYFDPATTEYNTLQSGPAALRVTGDVAPRAVSRTGEGLPVGKIAGPIEQGGRWRRSDQPPLYAQPWIYAALLVPVVLAAGGVAFRRRAVDGAAEAPQESRAISAAHPHLQAAERHLRQGEVRSFYRRVERSVVTFLDHRLELSRDATGMTGEALDRHLAREETPLSEREALHELLSACSEAQFSPNEPTPDAMRATLDHAHDLLRRLDDILSDAPGSA